VRDGASSSPGSARGTSPHRAESRDPPQTIPCLPPSGILDETAAELRYSAASTPADPVGADSISSTGHNFPLDATLPTATVQKTDFWDLQSDAAGGNTASRLLSPTPSIPLPADVGLIFGQPMPGVARRATRPAAPCRWRCTPTTACCRSTAAAPWCATWTEPRSSSIRRGPARCPYTGDALDHLPGPLVRTVAYDIADPAATPALATNNRFAEQPDRSKPSPTRQGGLSPSRSCPSPRCPRRSRPASACCSCSGSRGWIAHPGQSSSRERGGIRGLVGDPNHQQNQGYRELFAPPRVPPISCSLKPPEVELGWFDFRIRSRVEDPEGSP